MNLFGYRTDAMRRQATPYRTLKVGSQPQHYNVFVSVALLQCVKFLFTLLSCGYRVNNSVDFYLCGRIQNVFDFKKLVFVCIRCLKPRISSCLR